MSFAFVFPGQGSQSVGMMQAYADLPQIRSTFEEAAEVLQQDLWSLACHGLESDLAQTINTQPLMLTAGVAVYRAWMALGGPRPACVAGHSLGEYTALVAARSLSFADALRLTRLRAQAMQEAVPDGVGAMAAILGLEDDLVRAACQEAAGTDVVEPANFNSPGQVVIAGHRSAVERAVVAAKAKGAKRAVMLAMSVPSHCSLMRPAATRLQAALEQVTLASPAMAVIHNATVAPAASPEAIRSALVQQLFQPVRWVECVQALVRQGVATLYECGPGKVLAPLVKRIDGAAVGIALNDADSINSALGALRQGA